MLKNKFFGSLLVLVACLFLSMPTNAKAKLIDLNVDGGWYDFGFYGVGKSWQHEYSFTLLKPSILTVTDAHNATDRFEVFSNGESLGLTSEPLGVTSDDAKKNFDLAASDPRWSTGIWNLTPGTYLISGNTFQLAAKMSGGTAALRVDTAPVPAPAAVWLLGSALVGGLGLRKFRKN